MILENFMKINLTQTMHIYFVRLHMHDIIAIWHGNVLGIESDRWRWPKGANNMAMYWLGCEKSLVGAG